MRNKDHVSSERLEHLVRGLKPAQFVASGSWTNPVPVLRPVGIDTSQDSNDGDLLVIMSTLSQAQAAGQAAVFASAPAAGKARAAHDVEGQQATTAADLWCPQQLDASLATAGGVEGSMTTPANPGSAVEALLGDCALQQNFLTSTTENDGIPGKSTSAINRTNARNALASPHCNQRRCDSGEKTTEAAMQMVREEENAWQEWKHSELAAWSPPELSFPQAHPPNQIVEVDPDTEAHTRKHTTGVEPTPPIMRCTSIQEEDFNVTRTVGPLHRSASLPSRTSHLLEQNLSPTKTKNSILTKMSRATSALAQLRLKHSVFLTWVIIMKTTRNRTTYLRRPFGWWLRWTQWKTFLRQTVVKADRIQRQRCKNLALCRWACAVVVQAQIEDVIHYHRQRKLSRFFSSWSSRMVVRTIFHVTCLHDRIRMLREGFFCWACGSAWNLHKRRSITAAAYKRMRDHFRAWQAWVEESALCNEQHLHASLQQSLSKLAIHSVDSSLLRLTSTRQQQRMLCGSFVLWAQVLLDESQVEQGARDAKDRCLQELCMQAKLNLAAQRNSFLQRCSHAIEQWSFSTWTLKYDVAQKFLRHSTMAKHLCSWVMFLVIFATPNRENVHANHLAITDLKTGLSASQVVTARQQVVATDTTDTTCWQGVGALVPPPRPMLTRAMPTLQASMLNAHSKEKHMPPKHMSRKSLRQRHPDPARRAPVPPRHPAMGCRLGRNVWQVNVWQELLWELRMVKIRGGDCGKAGMRVLLRRVVPRGSERLKSCAIGASAIGASVLRARISLAALDSQNIFSVDSD